MRTENRELRTTTTTFANLRHYAYGIFAGTFRVVTQLHLIRQGLGPARPCRQCRHGLRFGGTCICTTPAVTRWQVTETGVAASASAPTLQLLIPAEMHLRH